MAIGNMLAAPEDTFTIAAAWVRSSFQTFVKYVIITLMAYHASESAHDKTAMEEEETALINHIPIKKKAKT
jgi:membrane protein YqaA with SNARE-associated domain